MKAGIAAENGAVPQRVQCSLLRWRSHTAPSDCPFFGYRMHSRGCLRCAHANVISPAALKTTSAVPPQTTPEVPMRVAVTTTLPVAPQTTLELATRVTPQFSFRTWPQVVFTIAARIASQSTPREASGEASRTTSRTVLGTVPKAVPEIATYARRTMSNSLHVNNFVYLGSAQTTSQKWNRSVGDLHPPQADDPALVHCWSEPAVALFDSEALSSIMTAHWPTANG